MDAKTQIDHFSNDLDALVERYRVEYDLSYAAVVGVMAMKSHLICSEACERSDELGEDGGSGDEP